MPSISLLMISSSSEKGGGPKHIALLSKYLPKDVLISYAMPLSRNMDLLANINESNFVNIKSRQFNILDLIKIMQFIYKRKINIIHAHGKGAGIIGRVVAILSGKKLIYTFHGIHTKCHKKIYKLFYLLYEYIFGFIDSYKVFVSASEKNYAVQKKITFTNSIIINNGVEEVSKKQKCDDIIKKYNIKKNDKIVICIGRLVPQKNIIEVLKIAKLLPNLRFFVLGGGPLFSELYEYKVFNKIDNLTFTGEINNVFKFLSVGHLYLSTSIYEGHPISILEAMSFGLPIVASKVIGNIDTLDQGKSGYFYTLGNFRQASQLIRKITNDKKISRKMGKESFKKQQDNFTANLMAQKYNNLYLKLLNNEKYYG